MLVPKKYVMSLFVHSLSNLTKLSEYFVDARLCWCKTLLMQDFVDASHKVYNVNGVVNFPLWY